MAVANYRAVVAYDGTAYNGFQIQVGCPTIQGELERAMQRLGRGAVRVHGAGRTDAGVHAQGQVISFRVDWKHGPGALQRAMNAVLPRDIAVRQVTEADERFHARFSATGRVYVYSIYQGQVREPLLARYAHQAEQPLDVAAMAAAARTLCGSHDFAAFGQPTVGDNTRREIRRAAWRLDEPAAAVAPMLRFEIEANAFLRGMVRRIVGTLLQVGSGAMAPETVAAILASGDISRAAPPAPAAGLCLWRVDYEEGASRRGCAAAPALLDE